jgi:D-lactate dehydrogenase (cytochrome)
VTPTLFVEVHGVSLADVTGRIEQIKKLATEMGASRFEWTDDLVRGAEMWAARHGCYWAASSLRNNTKLWVTDTAVPISKLAAVIKETEEDFANSSFSAPIVGHVGDGNFHLMGTKKKKKTKLFFQFADVGFIFFSSAVPVDVNNPKEMKEMQELAERLVRRAVAVGGTCSGEHGIGIGKKKWVMLQHGVHHVNVQRAIKDAFDPLHIFNPGKLFPNDDDYLFDI